MRQRVERVARTLTKEIGKAILEDLREPPPGFITVLRSEVTSDLKSARVIYSVMGNDQVRKDCEAFIRKYTKAIKRIVNDRLNLRYAVDLFFVLDTGLEHAFKIQGILNTLAKEKQSEPPAEAQESDAPKKDDPPGLES